MVKEMPRDHPAPVAEHLKPISAPLAFQFWGQVVGRVGGPL